jgi:hypothetical protein
MESVVNKARSADNLKHLKNRYRWKKSLSKVLVAAKLRDEEVESMGRCSGICFALIFERFEIDFTYGKNIIILFFSIF